MICFLQIIMQIAYFDIHESVVHVVCNFYSRDDNDKAEDMEPVPPPQELLLQCWLWHCLVWMSR